MLSRSLNNRPIFDLRPSEWPCPTATPRMRGSKQGVEEKIERNWTRPSSAKVGLECLVSITQLVVAVVELFTHLSLSASPLPRWHRLGLTPRTAFGAPTLPLEITIAAHTVVGARPPLDGRCAVAGFTIAACQKYASTLSAA